MDVSAPKLFSEKFGELEHSDLEFVSYFDIRASDLLRIFPVMWAKAEINKQHYMYATANELCI
jgi:hypothetical protein